MNALSPYKSVCMLVHSVYLNDSRVRRSCRSLATAGYTVNVLALWPGADLREAIPQPTLIDGITLHQLPLTHAGGKLRFAEMMRKAKKYALKHLPKAAIIHAHDLDTLLPAAQLAKKWGSKLIYDSHEWYTGSVHVGHRRFTKAVWQLIEENYIKSVDAIITVNDSIADCFREVYSNQLSADVHVLRNFDELPNVENGSNEPSFIAQLQAFAHRFEHLIVYGGYLQRGRGLEKLLDALTQLPASTGLFIAGEGGFSGDLKKMVTTLNLTDSVHFCGQLSLQNLYKVYQMSDIGYCYIEPISESYRMALPNKLSQYVQSGLAVLGSNLPEIKKLVVQYEVGLIAKGDDSIAAALTELIQKKELFKQNSVQSAPFFGWKEESKVLLNLYQSI